MKKVIILLLIALDLILLGFVNSEMVINREKHISNNVIADSTVMDLSQYRNMYYKDKNYSFVSDTNNYIISNKQDILNVIYTMLNSGFDFIDFKCSNNYSNCTTDLIEVLNDSKSLLVINNLVSSYNSYDDIKLSYTVNNEFKLSINKKYSSNEINILNNKIDYILKSITTNNMTDKEKIKKAHDYLANSVTYKNINKADTAFGALINGEAICSGYADAFSLILDRLEIPNYKVVSDNHVWNVIYLDGKWMHIDVTLDDPLTDKNDYGVIEYNYYLISTNKLKSINDNKHNFDIQKYQELKAN